MDLTTLPGAFDHAGVDSVLVVDPHGALYVILSLTDFKQALLSDAAHHLSVGDIATTSTALQRMVSRDLWSLPVVRRHYPRRLLGMVRREDLSRVCNPDMMRPEP